MTPSNNSELVFNLPWLAVSFKEYIHQNYHNHLLGMGCKISYLESSLFRAGPQFQSYFGQVQCNDQASFCWVTWALAVCFCISTTYKQHFVSTGWLWHPKTHSVFTNICSIHSFISDLWWLLGSKCACCFSCLWSCPPYGLVEDNC